MGICEGIDPDRFRVGTTGKVEVLQEDVEKGATEVVQDAVQSCPAEALSIIGLDV
jgi:ferredoxin